jgi:hypothetical protein
MSHPIRWAARSRQLLQLAFDSAVQSSECIKKERERDREREKRREERERERERQKVKERAREIA